MLLKTLQMQKKLLIALFLVVCLTSQGLTSVDPQIKMIRAFDDVTYPVEISGRFGALRHTEGGNGKVHVGIDYKLDKGTHLLAMADGVVEFVGDSETGYGWLIIINHGSGIKTYYAHLSKQWVLEGQQVKQGQKIAEVGNNGNSRGYHAHIEVRENNIPVHPAKYIFYKKNV